MFAGTADSRERVHIVVAGSRESSGPAHLLAGIVCAEHLKQLPICTALSQSGVSERSYDTAEVKTCRFAISIGIGSACDTIRIDSLMLCNRG